MAKLLLVTISLAPILAEVIFLLEERVAFQVEVVLTIVVGDLGILGTIMLLLKNWYVRFA